MSDKTKTYYSEEIEKCLEIISKYRLSAERIAYRFKAVDIGRLCAYLGIPDYKAVELEDAKLLVKALDYAPLEIKKTVVTEEQPVKRAEPTEGNLTTKA